MHTYVHTYIYIAYRVDHRFSDIFAITTHRPIFIRPIFNFTSFLIVNTDILSIDSIYRHLKNFGKCPLKPKKFTLLNCDDVTLLWGNLFQQHSLRNRWFLCNFQHLEFLEAVYRSNFRCWQQRHILCFDLPAHKIFGANVVVKSRVDSVYLLLAVIFRTNKKFRGDNNFEGVKYGQRNCSRLNCSTFFIYLFFQHFLSHNGLQKNFIVIWLLQLQVKIATITQPINSFSDYIIQSLKIISLRELNPDKNVIDRELIMSLYLCQN
eukprot:TRINITY_DN643_c0_g1_i4.p1 TRINITY_DN643_c0_g1~~TRINITY_DN643_c0_g1_i4.p1  ORF type:complete len:264 (+),score=-14.38 TRINITY_DN643_c0_g1_i4:419-1210(+)